MHETKSISIAAPSLGDEEWHALREPLESGWLSQGPKVALFEAAFAERHDVEHAVASTSCTTALHLALAALEVGPGDEVIVPAFTWVATANVVLYCGGTPVFVDVDPRTYNIDPAQVARKLTARTKAIIPVHLFGLCADMDGLAEVVPDSVAILEDAACAAGARYKARSAGGLGDAAAFSFHPRKSITTGEGGMVTTDNPRLAERARILRDHGASISDEQRHRGPAPYLLPEFKELGFNYRMTDLQAAIGLVQLGKLDDFVSERDHWARWYVERLAGLDWLQMPYVPPGHDHAWQAFVTVVIDGAPASRDKIMEVLQDQGVSTRPGTHAVTELAVYRRRFGLMTGQFPVATHLQEATMALPLHNCMTSADYEYVVERLYEV
jgi:dTDP-4-amino-4,6-dideoxygalactose transaminase